MFPVEPVPERIGAYQIQKHVGRSGAADIYTARMEGPLGFSRDVTLKLVLAGVEDDARFAEELAREASICARLNHPVVVRMFDFFEYDRRLVLVLEQVEGASLDRLIAHLTRRKQKLGDAGIFYLASQLGAALAHAHASTDEDGNLSPVIHRDIKPENVLIGWDGNIRLAGFGLGKILGRSPDSIAGTIRGTPGYMSPEQMRGERATVRSDVYGFGVLLWSLLSGREPPLDGARLEPLSSLRSDLPRELLATVDAALEPSPDRRRITCADMAQWFGKLTKAEAGREELRQKVLWLRSTRGPASKVDTSQKARFPKRRQAIHATRPMRRSSYAPPSSRAPASSRAPVSSSQSPPSSRAPASQRGGGLRKEVSPSQLPPPPSVAPKTAARGVPRQDQSPPSRVPATARGSSALPTARPTGEGKDSVMLRLPPPPPLPSGRTESNGSHAREPEAKQSNGTAKRATSISQQGIPAQNGRAPLSRTTTARPDSSTVKPPSVRTVSTPPSVRTTTSALRHAVHTEDVLAAAPSQRWNEADLPMPPPFDMKAAPLGPLSSVESTTQTNTAVNVGRAFDPRGSGPDTVRPAKSAPVTFTLTTQLLLAALTAALVVAVGLLVGDRSSSKTATTSSPPQVVTVEVNRGTEPSPQSPTAEEPAQRDDTTSPVTAPPAPTSSTTHVASTPPALDPSQIANTMGYLTVKGPEGSDVYINGVRRGATNETMLVACGQFFMRLAPKDAAGYYKPWSSPGQTVVVECQSTTTILARPNPVDPRTANAPGPGVGL